MFNAIHVAEDDAVVGARLTNGSEEVLLVTARARAIRFKEDEVRAMGLAAAGVMGIKPGARDDRVIGVEVARPQADVLLVTDQGMGKRTPIKDFPMQGRHGVGVVAGALVGKQRLVGTFVGDPDDKVIAVTSKGGAKVLKVEVAGRRGRNARGATIVKLKGGETIQRVVPMQPQFSLPPEPEAAPAKASRKSKPASKTKAPAPAKKGGARNKPVAKKGRPAGKTGKPAGKRR